MDRYIERQALVNFIDSCLKHEDKLQSVEKETLLAIKRKIEAIPAADVRHVVQGEWIDDGCIIRCKYCGEEKEFPHWRFCPNCGADMSGMIRGAVHGNDL